MRQCLPQEFTASYHQYQHHHPWEGLHQLIHLWEGLMESRWGHPLTELGSELGSELVEMGVELAVLAFQLHKLAFVAAQL